MTLFFSSRHILRLCFQKGTVIMSRILIVDDEKSIRITLCEFLKAENIQADSAEDAATALQMLEKAPYDVVFSDIIMPNSNGIDLLIEIKKRAPSIQVIIMTGEPTVETAIKAVQQGAHDYLPKPINRKMLMKAANHALQVKSLLDQKAALEELNHIYQAGLERLVGQRTTALQNAMQSIIILLSTMTEIRDPYTAGHQRRVGNLSAAIAGKMGMASSTVELIRIIGYIHDIGKIVVPSEILTKPGVLSPLERQIIQEHSQKGYEMLSKVDLPAIIAETVLQHHERCDGSGYPRGLKGSEITMEAQILMVADTVEAMMSHRPYRAALGLDAALNEIEKNSDKLYNPEIVSACKNLFLEGHYNNDDSEHIYYPIGVV